MVKIGYNGWWQRGMGTLLGEFDMLFLPGEEGQGLLEYGLVIVLVAIVVVAILLLTGTSIGDVWSTAVDELLRYFQP